MSILSALERAKDNIKKFKRAKCDIEWCTHKISVEEKLLKDSIHLAKEYAESAITVAKSLDDKKRWLATLIIYVDDNEGIINDTNKAEELVKKIARLQEQVAKLTQELEAKEVTDARTNTAAQS